MFIDFLIIRLYIKAFACLFLFFVINYSIYFSEKFLRPKLATSSKLESNLKCKTLDETEKNAKIRLKERDLSNIRLTKLDGQILERFDEEEEKILKIF